MGREEGSKQLAIAMGWVVLPAVDEPRPDHMV